MKIRETMSVVLVVLIVGIGLSCSSAWGESKEKTADGQFVRLTGAGASFPAPLYNKWFKDFHALHQNIQIDYQSVGSGSGIKNVIKKTVDFGASDAAMTPDEIKQVDVGAQLLPMTAGSIVLAYNLPGISGLKLSREAYAGIFLGKVQKWNDPVIVKTNPGLKLPDSPINVVVRADASGTSFVFTKHLAAISPEFAKNPGFGTMPNWPVGTRSKGNEGVTASLTTTPGSIGYVEYGYAKGQNLPMVTIENKAGKYPLPTIETAQAALASAELPEDLIGWMPDPPGDKSYPIVTYTWMLCYKQYADANKRKALKEMVEYGLTEGQKSSERLGYIPLPEPVVQKVRAALNNIQGK